LKCDEFRARAKAIQDQNDKLTRTAKLNDDRIRDAAVLMQQEQQVAVTINQSKQAALMVTHTNPKVSRKYSFSFQTQIRCNFIQNRKFKFQKLQHFFALQTVSEMVSEVMDPKRNVQPTKDDFARLVQENLEITEETTRRGAGHRREMARVGAEVAKLGKERNLMASHAQSAYHALSRFVPLRQSKHLSLYTRMQLDAKKAACYFALTSLNAAIADIDRTGSTHGTTYWHGPHLDALPKGNIPDHPNYKNLN
jgi:hypothetical protein